MHQSFEKYQVISVLERAVLYGSNRSSWNYPSEKKRKKKTFPSKTINGIKRPPPLQLSYSKPQTASGPFILSAL